MDERKMKFRVGVMVAATLLTTAILAVMFGELPTLINKDYEIHILFDQAPGVSKETPVRKSGILIGRVTDVRFATDAQGREDTRVLVTVLIQGDKHVYEDETPRVQTSLLGDSAVEFVRRPPSTRDTQAIRPGATIEGTYTPDPAQVMGNLQGDLQRTMADVGETSDELGKAAKSLTATLDNVNAILTENRQGLKAAIDEASLTLREVKETANATRSFIGDAELQRNVKESLSRLPQIVDETQVAIQGIQKTVGSMNRNLENVEQFTASLGEIDVADRLNRSVANLETLLGNLAVFSADLKNPNGTINRLVNDPDLYQNLNRAAMNIDQITRELKPIVNDARVLTDKVSRHPGVIIRDAVHPGPGIK
ncbi:MAG: MlaD family protein [Planctomycetota bacterium]